MGRIRSVNHLRITQNHLGNRRRNWMRLPIPNLLRVLALLADIHLHLIAGAARVCVRIPVSKRRQNLS